MFLEQSHDSSGDFAALAMLRMSEVPGDAFFVGGVFGHAVRFVPFAIGLAHDRYLFGPRQARVPGLPAFEPALRI